MYDYACFKLLHPLAGSGASRLLQEMGEAEVVLQAGQKSFAGAFTQILQIGCYVRNGCLMLIFIEKLMPNHYQILSDIFFTQEL